MYTAWNLCNCFFKVHINILLFYTIDYLKFTSILTICLFNARQWNNKGLDKNIHISLDIKNCFQYGKNKYNNINFLYHRYFFINNCILWEMVYLLHNHHILFSFFDMGLPPFVVTRTKLSRTYRTYSFFLF